MPSSAAASCRPPPSANCAISPAPWGQLVREIARHTQRVQKVLEDAHLKLTAVPSDVLSTSGRAILDALIAGERDPERLASLTTGRRKANRPEFVAALQGRVTPHHQFRLRLHLGQIDPLEAAVGEIDTRIGDQLTPCQHAAARLITMPGISDTVARVVIAEIGIGMGRVPTAGHLISWAGLCARLYESAGKRRSTRTRRSAPLLKTTLVQAAWAAVRKKDTYLGVQFLRLKTRRGPKNAIIAVGASMLRAIYFMLQRDATYHDLGGGCFDRRDRALIARRLLGRLKDSGYQVQVAHA